jgi:hypothetical protein
MSTTATLSVGGRLKWGIKRTVIELSTKLGDGNLSALISTDEDVLEASTANLFQLGQLLWWYLPIIQTHALEI